MKFSLPLRIVAVLLASFASASAQGTAFTYQGRLHVGTNTANGLYDLRFTVHDALNGGGQQGTALTNAATSVSNGLFTATLNFGAGVFNGGNRWLEIWTRTNGSGAFTPLTPRQPLTPTPYAITASNLSGVLPTSQLTGTLPDVRLSSNVSLFGAAVDSAEITDGTIVDADIASGAAIADTKLATISAAGKVSDAALSANIAKLNGTNVLTGTNTFAGVMIATNTNNVIAGSFTGPLPTSQLTGTLPDARLSGNVSLFGGTVDSAEITDGTIVNADIAPGAAIADTKLATIGTAGKVADSALSTNVLRLLGSNVTLRTGPIPNGGAGGLLITDGDVSPLSADFWHLIRRDNGVRRSALYSAGGREPLSLQEQGGNVGIGTPNPGARLHVVGSGFFGDDTGSLPANSGAGVRIFRDSASGLGHLYAYNYTATSATNLILQQPGGNVGIGTLNPVTKLDVAGTVTAFGFNGNGSGLTGLAASNVNGTLADARLSANVALRAGGNTFFGNQIISFGRVGIGATNPIIEVGYPPFGWDGLHTRSLFNAAVNLIQGSNSARVHLRADGNNTNSKDFIIANGANQIEFRWLAPNLGNGPLAMTITSNANVGIGTLNPATRLDVVGTVTAFGYVGNGGGLTGLAAANLTGTVPLARLPATVVTNGATGVNFSGTFSGNGNGMTNVSVLLGSVKAPGLIDWPGNFTITAIPGVNADSVTTADVNGDGKVDLVTGFHNAGTGIKLNVLINNGSGAFTSTSEPTVGGAVIAVTSSDVNGDGKPDIISANFYASPGALTVLTNNGSGDFALSANLGTSNGTSTVIAADVNGDAKPDLITANDSSLVTVWTNNGSGGFAIFSSFGLNGSSKGIAAADVNGDGKVDLFSPSSSNPTLLTNNGSGSFVLAVTPVAPTPVDTVALADVNGDGKTDLLAAFSNQLVVWTNNGAGAFLSVAGFPNYPILGDGYPYKLTPADVNGDGRVDVIAAGPNTNVLSVLTNNGSGQFATAATPFLGNNLRQVAAADVNGDGRTDLISTGSSLSVLLNTPTVVGQFVGDGSGLTGIAAANLIGSVPSSALTSVPAASLTGTVAEARLSSNVALRAGGNAFTGEQSVMSGNVGIGTSNPDELIHLVGTTPRIRVENTGNGYAGTVAKNNQAEWFTGIYQPAGSGSGEFAIFENSPVFAARLVVTTNGNVGIGKGNPATKLDVVGTVTATGFVGDGSGLTGIPAANVSGTLADARLSTNVALRSGGNTFSGNQILTTGKVGIGITNPITGIGYPGSGWDGLHARSTVNNGLSIVQGGNSARLHLRTDNNITNISQDFVIANGANQIDFQWLGAGLGNRLLAMMITTNGNIGIGTSSPTEKLHVSGNIRATGNIFAAGNVAIGATTAASKLHVRDTSDTEISLQSGANDRRWTLQASGGTDGVGLGGTFQLIDRTAGASRMLITTGGNVGIGTSTPATKLEVAGEVTTTAVNITSDRNAKEQFKPVNPREVLAKVVGLPITEWQYKTQADARHIGPMAQDFREAFALGRDEKHITSVDADGVALAAIQGLNEVVREQRAAIEKLETQNRELESRLAERLATLEKFMEQAQHR